MERKRIKKSHSVREKEGRSDAFLDGKERGKGNVLREEADKERNCTRLDEGEKM